MNFDLPNSALVGKTSTASGWGLMENGEFSDLLMIVDQVIVATTAKINGRDVNDERVLQMSQENSKGAGHGDSGGRLLLNNV